MADSFSTKLDRAVLRLSGKDAVKFLQGILTRDITKLGPTQALYALMLTPQGKFLYDFFLVKDGDAVLLDVDVVKKPEIVKKFSMYKLRSEVNIEETKLSVFALWGDAALALFAEQAPGTLKELPEGSAFIDPRTTAMFVRLIGKKSPTGFPAGDSAHYNSLRIHACVPDTRNDMIAEKVFPLFFRMDELNAIDFDKGCYVGQEVTTRSKHRGNLHKSIFTVKGKGPLPGTGTTVTQEGKAVGELLSVAGDVGIAVLEKEALGKLMAGEVGLMVVQR